MSLFDPEPYTKPGLKPREQTPPRRQTPVPDTRAVVVDSTWRVVTEKQPGVVHAAMTSTVHGGFRTFCGVVSGARTFDPGLVVHGCRKCIEAGAPHVLGGVA